MRQNPVLVLCAGAVLSIAGCGASQPVDTRLHTNPPRDPPTNPPPPAVPTLAPPAGVDPGPTNPPELPTWDDLGNGLPAGVQSTNPPSPELIVHPDGTCYKHLERRMTAPAAGEVRGDRVQVDCPPDGCGTQIACPVQATSMLDVWKKAHPGG